MYHYIFDSVMLLSTILSTRIAYAHWKQRNVLVDENAAIKEMYSDLEVIHRKHVKVCETTHVKESFLVSALKTVGLSATAITAASLVGKALVVIGL